MSFTRLIYDGCKYNDQLHQQEGEFWHHMDKQRFNLPAQYQQRHNVKGILQNNPVGTLDKGHPDIVSRENELWGLTRTYSLCPGNKYNPNHQCPNKNCHLNGRPGSCEKCVKHKDTHLPNNRNTPNPLIHYHRKVNYKTCNNDSCF